MKHLLALVFLMGCAGSGASAGDVPTATVPTAPTAEARKTTTSKVEYRPETIAVLLHAAPDSQEAKDARRLIERRFPGVKVEPAIEAKDMGKLREEAKQTTEPELEGAIAELARWNTVRIPTTIDPNAVLAFVESLPSVETAYLSLPPIPAQPA